MKTQETELWKMIKRVLGKEEGVNIHLFSPSKVAVVFSPVPVNLVQGHNYGCAYSLPEFSPQSPRAICQNPPPAACLTQN